MGCGRSKSIPEVNLNNLASSLTTKQKELVMETLPLVAEDLEGSGLILFQKLFQNHPELKKMFSFGRDGTINMDDPRLRRHALGVMEALGTAIQTMDNSQMFTETLVALGQQHFHYNVKPAYFPELWPAVDHMLRQRLMYNYTLDVRDAWKCVFEFSISKMLQGLKAMNQHNGATTTT